MRLDLDGIYGAIGDERAFGNLSNRVAELVGTRSAIITELNADGAADHMQLCHWTEDLVAYYAEHFAANDPWTRLAIEAGQFGKAVALDALMSPEEFAQTEMRNDCIRRFGDDTGRCLGVMPKLGRPGLMVAVHKAERDAAFGQAEAARLDGVYSHLERAVHLHRMFERERAHCGTLQDLADQSDQGLVRVDRELRVLGLSASAKRILDQRDGMALYFNRIVAPSGLETALRAAVAGVIDKAANVRTGFLCPRPSGLRAFRIVVLPAGFAAHAGAILKIDDPELAPPPKRDGGASERLRLVGHGKRACRGAFGRTVHCSDRRQPQREPGDGEDAVEVPFQQDRRHSTVRTGETAGQLPPCNRTVRRMN